MNKVSTTQGDLIENVVDLVPDLGQGFVKQTLFPFLRLSNLVLLGGLRQGLGVGLLRFSALTDRFCGRNLLDRCAAAMAQDRRMSPAGQHDGSLGAAVAAGGDMGALDDDGPQVRGRAA